jgi:hypothetical protein
LITDPFHNKKLAKLQEEESLRRSVRLQKTPRTTSKSPHTVPLNDQSGRASKRQRTLSTAIDSEESTGDSSAAAPGESAPTEIASMRSNHPILKVNKTATMRIGAGRSIECIM